MLAVAILAFGNVRVNSSPFLTALLCFLSESNESYFGAYKIGSTVIIPKVSWTTHAPAMTIEASI